MGESRRQRTEAEFRAAEYGIDLSLIDLALSRTPFERVLAHERALELAGEIARAGESDRAKRRTAAEASR